MVTNRATEMTFSFLFILKIRVRSIKIITLHWGQRVIVISGSLFWSKTVMELVFNLSVEFRRAQLAKSSLLISTLVPLGSFQIF